ncbi:MAG: hypothetical protein MZV63_40975 [Marinilabiliales bacterium]|nr:hypothetical protein [Marinilabiliales bacterium]
MTRLSLVSDKYDIWSLDPSAARTPLNVTIDGSNNRVTYRLLDFDPENDFIDPSEKQYLQGINEVTRAQAFYSLDMKKKEAPLKLTGGDYFYSAPIKARKSDAVIYSREDFKMFPDYLISDLTFARREASYKCQSSAE